VADDREMWEQIRRGNARAFDEFYRQNSDRLLRFLGQLLRNEAAAQDLTQEIFLRLWQKPNGFEPTRGPLRAYLFGIGRKRSMEWWRQRGAVVEGLPASAEKRCQGDAEKTSLIADALSRLEPDHRALLWLREVEGQSYEELAGILEIPIGTVKSRLFTAREELRRIWLGEGTPEREKS
jgi:RNA polymerase sigma-70 factor, ECF subfamily